MSNKLFVLTGLLAGLADFQPSGFDGGYHLAKIAGKSGIIPEYCILSRFQKLDLVVLDSENLQDL